MVGVAVVAAQLPQLVGWGGAAVGVVAVAAVGGGVCRHKILKAKELRRAPASSQIKN